MPQSITTQANRLMNPSSLKFAPAGKDEVHDPSQRLLET